MARTGVGRVRDQQDGAALALELLHPVDALALEALVADGQHLVDHQDVGVDVDGHGEAEPDVHARGVELHLVVDELLELGEVHDVVEDAVDLALGQPEQRAVQVDVLPAGQVRLEARRRAPAGRPACPAPPISPEVGWRTPQMHLSRVDLPEPLRPRMPTVSPSLDVERDVVEGPEVLGGRRFPPWMTRSFSELYFSWYRRNRLEMSRDVDGEVAHASELLGEVALEPAERRPGRRGTGRRRATSTPTIEAGVPADARVGST